MCMTQQIPLLHIKILPQVTQNVLYRDVYVSLFVMAIKPDHKSPPLREWVNYDKSIQ